MNFEEPNNQEILFRTAITEGDISKVLELIKLGFDINHFHLYDTPLNIAVNLGNIEIVRTLLKHGANPNTGIEGYRTATDLCYF